MQMKSEILVTTRSVIDGNKEFEPWQGVVMWTKEDCFIPAAITGSEDEVFMMASFDGIPVVMEGTHFYVPASWMRREFSESEFIVSVIQIIESRREEAFRCKA